MNRDAILATLIGFGVGLFIMVVILFGPSLVKKFPAVSLPKLSIPKITRSQPTPTPTPGPKPLTIQSPLPDSLESKAKIVVSGTTQPDSLVVVEGPSDEAVVKTNGEGKFAGEVTLSEGKNELIVTSYANQKAERKTVTVFYTPEEF